MAAVRSQPQVMGAGAVHAPEPVNPAELAPEIQTAIRMLKERQAQAILNATDSQMTEITSSMHPTIQTMQQSGRSSGSDRSLHNTMGLHPAIAIQFSSMNDMTPEQRDLAIACENGFLAGRLNDHIRHQQRMEEAERNAIGIASKITSALNPFGALNLHPSLKRLFSSRQMGVPDPVDAPSHPIPAEFLAPAAPQLEPTVQIPTAKPIPGFLRDIDNNLIKIGTLTGDIKIITDESAGGEIQTLVAVRDGDEVTLAQCVNSYGALDDYRDTVALLIAGIPVTQPAFEALAEPTLA